MTVMQLVHTEEIAHHRRSTRLTAWAKEGPNCRVSAVSQINRGRGGAQAVYITEHAELSDPALVAPELRKRRVKQDAAEGRAKSYDRCVRDREEIMGLIRGALHIATYGAVSPKSKKQRMAAAQLAAMQGASDREIKIAGSRNFDFVNQEKLRRLRERAPHRQVGAEQAAPPVSPVTDPGLDYHPVRLPGDARLHLIYGDLPGLLTLCGKSGAWDVREQLSIDDVTCRECRIVAGDGGSPRTTSILTGNCPKCFQPIVWYKDLHPTPVHAATGEFACPRDDSDTKELHGQDNGGLAAELERLAALHASGALDDEEFRAAKARIVGAPPQWPGDK